MDPFSITATDTLMGDEHVRDMVDGVQKIIEHNSKLIFLFILILLFQGRIMQFVAVMGWKVGRRYNENMKVVVNGYYARINKIGLFYVEFYMYNKINTSPDRGWSWKVAGNKLDDLQIWIPLEKHEMQDAPIQTLTHIE